MPDDFSHEQSLVLDTELLLRSPRKTSYAGNNARVVNSAVYARMKLQENV